MAYKDTQKSRGTQRSVSTPSVKRSGRDSGFGKSGSIGHKHSKSSADVARSGRGSGTGTPGHAYGVKKGKGPGSASPKRVAKDGVNGSLSL